MGNINKRTTSRSSSVRKIFDTKGKGSEENSINKLQSESKTIQQKKSSVEFVTKHTPQSAHEQIARSFSSEYVQNQTLHDVDEYRNTSEIKGNVDVFEKVDDIKTIQQKDKTNSDLKSQSDSLKSVFQNDKLNTTAPKKTKEWGTHLITRSDEASKREKPFEKVPDTQSCIIERQEIIPNDEPTKIAPQNFATFNNNVGGSIAKVTYNDKGSKSSTDILMKKSGIRELKSAEVLKLNQKSEYKDVTARNLGVSTITNFEKESSKITQCGERQTREAGICFPVKAMTKDLPKSNEGMTDVKSTEVKEETNKQTSVYHFIKKTPGLVSEDKSEKHLSVISASVTPISSKINKSRQKEGLSTLGRESVLLEFTHSYNIEKQEIIPDDEATKNAQHKSSPVKKNVRGSVANVVYNDNGTSSCANELMQKPGFSQLKSAEIEIKPKVRLHSPQSMCFSISNCFKDK